MVPALLVEPAAVGLGNDAVIRFRRGIRLGHVEQRGRVVWIVLVGPIPVGQGDGRIHVLQLQLEIIEIGAVPGEELLPPVLALVGVKARPVAEAARVLVIVVERLHLGESVAQPRQLLPAQRVDVLADFDAIVVVEILVGRAGVEGMLLVAARPSRHLRLVNLGRRARLVLFRTAVVDPILDELNVSGGDRLAVPRQLGKLGAVKGALAAQPEDQAGRRAAA